MREVLFRQIFVRQGGVQRLSILQKDKEREIPVDFVSKCIVYHGCDAHELEIELARMDFSYRDVARLRSRAVGEDYAVCGDVIAKPSAFVSSPRLTAASSAAVVSEAALSPVANAMPVMKASVRKRGTCGSLVLSFAMSFVRLELYHRPSEQFFNIDHCVEIPVFNKLGRETPEVDERCLHGLVRRQSHADDFLRYLILD